TLARDANLRSRRDSACALPTTNEVFVTYAPLNLAGRTAVVIGGTSGIGRVLSLGMVEAGADVVASARRSAEVDSTAAEIEQRGRRSLRVPSDVTDRASLEHLLSEVKGALGKVDIL